MVKYNFVLVYPWQQSAFISMKSCKIGNEDVTYFPKFWSEVEFQSLGVITFSETVYIIYLLQNQVKLICHSSHCLVKLRQNLLEKELFINITLISGLTAGQVFKNYMNVQYF